MIAAICFLIIITIISLLSGFHKVEEGYVGIYFKFGKLEKEVSYPGFHFMIPYINTF